MAPFLPPPGITRITSDDETITVTNPTGPTADLSAVGGGGGSSAFDLPLSYGHGNATDKQLTGGTWWLTETTIADSVASSLGEAREWETGTALGTIRLLVRVRSVTLVGSSMTITVTVDGSTIACSVEIPIGTTTDTTYTATLPIYIGATSRVGAQASFTESFASGDADLTVRIVGEETTATGPASNASLWHESFDDYTTPMEFVAGNVSLLPNRGSAGSELDGSVPLGLIGPEWIADTGDGVPAMRMTASTPHRVIGNLSDSDNLMTEPTTFVTPDFHFFYVGTINAIVNVRFALMWLLAAGGAVVGGLIPPVAATFALVWQWLDQASTNISATANHDGAIYGNRVIYQIGVTSGTLFFKINGVTIALVNAGNPTTAGFPAQWVKRWSAGQGTGDEDQDDFARLLYPRALTNSEESQTFDYLNAKFKVGV